MECPLKFCERVDFEYRYGQRRKPNPWNQDDLKTNSTQSLGKMLEYVSFSSPSTMGSFLQHQRDVIPRVRVCFTMLIQRQSSQEHERAKYTSIE